MILLIILLLATECQALYSRSDKIVELTPMNFDNLVIRSNKIWIIQFFAPWCKHCQNFVTEFLKVANALSGVVKVGAVNSNQYKELTRKYEIRAFPTIYIFLPNEDQPIHYDGNRTAGDIVETTLRIAQAKANKVLMTEVPKDTQYYLNRTNIIILNDTHFDKHILLSEEMWLVNFYAPWCEYCEKFAPVWVEIGVQLNGKIKVGVIDATTEEIIANKYNIERYPTVKFFSSKAEKSPIHYDGDYLLNSVTHWALEQMSFFLPDPELIQIVDDYSFQMSCDEKPLCIFTVLPHIFDCQSKCRNAYLKLLKELGKKFKQHLWGWAWSEASSQPHIEKTLSFGGFGYPALAVINVKKSVYSVFKGSFSDTSMYEFLRDIAYSKKNKYNFLKSRDLIDIIICEIWDGKDRHPLVEGDSQTDYLPLKDEL